MAPSVCLKTCIHREVVGVDSQTIQMMVLAGNTPPDDVISLTKTKAAVV